jgi:hypothetical protein
MAFALSVVLFCYFWGVGYPVVSLLHTRRDLVRNALIAPAVGVVVTIYLTYVFSRLGYPVGKFAHFLALGTTLITAVAWIRLRPPLAGRHLLPYIPIAIVAFSATGWPLLNHGFAWLGDINPDMTNYVLDAHRLVDQAYIQSPDPETWRNQRDFAAYYVIFPMQGVRSGSELLLAWVITISGRNGLMIYMPVLVAVHVALIAAAAAMITTPHRYARLLAAALMSLSAMLTLGVILQLIGQVLGLMLLALGVVICLSRFYRLCVGLRWRFVGLAALIMATFLISYPELLPFFVIAFVIYHGLGSKELCTYAPPAFKVLLAIAVLACVLTAPDILRLLAFMLHQVQGAGMRFTEIFPYFLIPSGLAALWGLRPFGAADDPWLPTSIVLGATLGVLAILSACWLNWRREPAAAVTAVMLAMAAPLFLTDNGFGTLKLAMYMQPFLLPTMVLAASLAVRGAR